MFSYYGGKSKDKLNTYYPLPQYSTIIEPFAGSAKYSVLHYEHDVILNDVNPTIYEIWKWLLEEATVNDLQECLALCEKGIDRRHLAFHPSAKSDYLGLCFKGGQSSPGNIGSSFSYTNKALIRKAITLLPVIKHWQCSNLSYEQLPDVEATWFIDPPYQFGGELYPYNEIDYSHLADWCKSRRGQVIVCENNRADWLPFELFLYANNTQGNVRHEMIWYRSDKTGKLIAKGVI